MSRREILFSDVKVKAQIGNYEIQVKKLYNDVVNRDVSIKGHIAVKETKIKEALVAKQEADKAHIEAASATKRYNDLVARIPKNSSPVSVENSTSELPPTASEVATDCGEVIKDKDKEIIGLNLGLTNCFDAKTAADQAIKELQANEVDLKTSGTIKDKINNDLSKQVESQKRRKWLYFVGGIITAYAVDKTVRKK